MLKNELRLKYKKERKALRFEEIQDLSLTIANNCLSLPIWDKRYFHLFLPIEAQKEINTEFLLQILAGRDKEILISKSDFETRKMTHFLLTDSTRIMNNDYGIPEPVDGIEVPASKIDVIFVPLLAYDKSGHRVGYGKGFYDAFLSQCKTDVIKVGLSYFDPEDAITDVLDTDVQLDFCVTPYGIFEFNIK
ncbi:5-formyltetrahydrofolate cyclo-ligase [Flavobacterium cauense R2A-7]|uniref:5-formyltetrahydrofolate cyclo-ligase n=1 Tax=Flavobacterium cauense R2A-7 TaxID=1341154 RepID=A0A562LNY3_9FLAO|nr:5-formyltetrahydrofolate cyclo-ligase [Flavobacterium cauense]KGO80331.1 5-formyltetrahydrofolate cyclo-ligase [Flavobacterium cauense R2A-7]TWI09334.1 5-formyltetrahydrofolate cyclo-ligase [Flavobacterium cauense R2A-7]